jgi:hypothetical protein
MTLSVPVTSKNPVLVILGITRALCIDSILLWSCVIESWEENARWTTWFEYANLL